MLLLSVFIGYAQLPDFNFNMTSTAETCSGNGAIEMFVSNTSEGSTITYTLYLLPDAVNPIAETTEAVFNNLEFGNYSVVATQDLGTESNTQQEEITVDNELNPLDFDVSHTTVTDCDTTGSIVVNVTSGNAVLFEIISGPQTVSPQTSNVFNGLNQGTYIVRVFDDCDNAVSKTYTMVLNTNNISMTLVSLPNVFTSCIETVISNNIIALSNTSVIYPISVTYTVYPPDGSADIVYTQNITSGAPQGVEVTQNIPLFGEEIFTVNMLISDSCGNELTVNHSIDPNPKVSILPFEVLCGQFINLSLTNYSPPFTIDFTAHPVGFDPLAFNTNYPGPFADSGISFGDEENPIPTGIYNVSVTDSCGRIGTEEIEIIQEGVEPLISTSNSGCSTSSGFIEIRLPDREITMATITSAPAGYVDTLPSDVAIYIDNGILTLSENIIAGDYSFEIMDNCGFNYIIEVSVPIFQFIELSELVRPDCDTPTGSLTLSSNHGNLISVNIVSAPQTFTETLPFNVNENIDAEGVFFIANLPIGNYVLEAEDTCNYQYTNSVDVLSYSSTPEAYSLNRNCGSFDVTINDADQTVTNISYWFQMYFPDSDTWGHPNTGVPFQEGEIPDTTTAIQIENAETLYNIFLVGDFRLIKSFQSFNSNDSNAFCLDVFANFTIFSDLNISGVYNLDCTGSGGSDASDVIIDVIGVEPYNFSIISPVFIDNADNNTFQDLAPGIYEIRVEDSCGSIENTIVNTENLLPLARANAPGNLLICTDGFVDQQVFLLSSQNEQVLGNQDPNNYNVTYHLSQAEANTGNNPLPNEYLNVSNPQTIFARVAHDNLIVCYATTSFSLIVGETPQLTQEEAVYICAQETVMLSANSGFDSYLWSTGETTASIIVDQAGIYSVEVSNNYQNLSCSNTQEFIVNSSESATIDSIITSDWTLAQNSITVLVSGSGDYLFSLDNINFQESNTFTNLESGEYVVFVKDSNGCDTVFEEVFLLNYPQFFTPNGDDKNEFWQIKYSSQEPELKVVIFDRFGKLITQFGSQDRGWDGTYNGFNMPTNDYWFEVTRGNNLKYKGHFTLKR